MIYSNIATEKAMNILNEFISTQVDFYGMTIDDEILRIKIKEITRTFDEVVNDIVEVKERNYYILLIFFLCRKLKLSIEKESERKILVKNIFNLYERDVMDVSNDDTLGNKDEVLSCYNQPASVYSSKSKNQYNKCKKYKRSNFPKHISRILKDWLIENANSPYPSESEKQTLSDATGLDHTQINNWFINARRRILPILRNKK